MIIIGLLAGLFTFLLAGIGATLLAQRGRSALNLIETCACGWFLGTGIVSLLLWSCGFFLSGPGLQILVTVIAAMLGGLGVASVRSERPRIFVPTPRGRAEWFLTGVLVLQCGILFYASFSSGLGWDGLLNWEVKARYAFLNGGVLPASYWSDVSRDFTHQSYPLWIPFSELWLYLWMGEAHQFWIKLLFPLYYVAGAILLVTFGSRLTGRRWIGLLAATLLCFVPCLTNSPGGVVVGYVDVPLALLYLAAIGYLLLQANEIDPGQWRLFALCLALLPWAKREGAVLWSIAALCAVLVILRTGRSWRTLVWVIPGLVIMLCWRAFCTAMAQGPEKDFLPLNWTNVVDHLPRAWPIARAVLNEMGTTTSWSLLWPIVGLAFLALLVRARDRRLLILFVAVGAPICLYAATYILSSWPSWMGHLETSLSRLVLHVMPVAWLAIALALRPPSQPAKRRFASAR